MAITNQGDKQWCLQKNSINGETFCTFVANLQYPKGTILLMDNASIHKTKEFKNILLSKGYQVIYTPPYSPEFNPIELIFGIIKNKYYKSRYMRQDFPVDAHIARCTEQVNNATIVSCFDHVATIISRLQVA
jgi:transposase